MEIGQFVIYSLENCGFSKAAEKLFKNSDTKHRIINISRNESEQYKNDTMSTFPQIFYIRSKGKEFIDGAVIGGYDSFVAILETNELKFIEEPKSKQTMKQIKRKIKQDF